MSHLLSPSSPAVGELEGANFVARTTSATDSPAIREDVLRDPRYPVHQIADQLLPYLRVLVEQFHPQQVILFGSYAYGEPDIHSDVDLLVVMPLLQSPVRQCMAILRAWRPLRRSVSSPLPMELLVESPDGHEWRLQKSAGFYDEITRRGLRLT